MIDKNKMYNVKNRSAGIAVYSIPELHVTREFAPGQVMKISYDELERLTFVDGGKYLIANYLQIQDPDALENLDVETEPEYNMSEKDVIELITNGSIDEFMDALDFAPSGIIDLIKEFAVSLPMNDASKRIALKEKTGYDVESVIRHLNEDKEEENDGKSVANTTAKKRRVNKETEKVPEGRRTTPKKYEVVE